MDELISDQDIVEFANFEYHVPNGETWQNQIQFNAFHVTTTAETGRTIFVGMVLDNPQGGDVFPRLDELNLVVDRDFVAGDLNGDGDLNLLDVAPFIDQISSSIYQVQADINLDGFVDYWTSLRLCNCFRSEQGSNAFESTQV